MKLVVAGKDLEKGALDSTCISALGRDYRGTVCCIGKGEVDLVGVIFSGYTEGPN